MANAVVHLAIAKKYMLKNRIKNQKDFIKGTLYPDAYFDNDKSHYTDLDRKPDLLNHVRGKVNLYKFLKEHSLCDDFEKGWFLHLVTDYLFFLECFEESYLQSLSYKDFCKELYFAYDCLNTEIAELYNITIEDYQDYPSEYYPGIPYQKCILPKEMIVKFIDRVSSINLEEYIKKIKENKQNIIP